MSTKITLLCEDLQTDVFVRRFLSHRNFRSRDIFTCPLPDGRQSGEQWVRARFPGELKKIRRRRQAFLVVVIDADGGSTGGRHTQLEQQCREDGVETRKPGDPVAVAVPRRNIEAWFEYLRGKPVDETENYPRLRRETDCKPLADHLHVMCHERQRLDEPVPPSLREACEEYRKLKRGDPRAAP